MYSPTLLLPPDPPTRCRGDRGVFYRLYSLLLCSIADCRAGLTVTPLFILAVVAIEAFKDLLIVSLLIATAGCLLLNSRMSSSNSDALA